MKKFMKKFVNDNGFIAMAFAVVAVALMSVIAIARIGVTDTQSVVSGYQTLQELHLIRSEGVRSLRATENMLVFAQNGLPEVVDMGGITKTINSGFGINTFKVRTKMIKGTDVQTSAFDFAYNYGIHSLANAWVGSGNKSRKSRVELYGRKMIKKNSFAGYHYFTETDEGINTDIGDGQVYFYGKDEIWGKVRTNSDIWLKKTTGPNNGWPLFHDHVYTSGEIRATQSIPYGEVFLDGYTEHAAEVEYPTNAMEARTGPTVGVGDDDVLFAVVTGNSYNAWYGARVETTYDSVIIYDLAADGDDTNLTHEDSIDCQYFTNIDTIWNSGGAGQVSNNSIFVDGELWLMGEFAGRQTWCSADTMYLAGDILLSGTAKGDTPDGNNIESGLNGVMNSTDVVGLISEKSIIIQYGFRHPDDSIRVKYNCGTYEDEVGDEDDGGIYIYAAMCALGRGETSMEDGTFSFQYQHPHKGLFYRANNAYEEGWIAAVDANGIQHPHPLLNDHWGPLHFRELDEDWPAAMCYPFYGPLWPESVGQTFTGRGTIRLFGSVAQRRRGFVHRSGTDPLNHSTADGWDLENYKFGSNDNGVPAPGVPASDTGVGYQKGYHYDNRFRISPPPKFPEVKLKGGITQFDAASWYVLTGDSAPETLRDN